MATKKKAAKKTAKKAAKKTAKKTATKKPAAQPAAKAAPADVRTNLKKFQGAFSRLGTEIGKAVVGHDELVRDLFPVLQEIIGWHQRGTRYQIHVDPQDGLLYAGEAGVQLTWMDAKVDDWVVTPRIGKPVEINALWYNALCIMRDFAPEGEQSRYVEMAEQVKGSFGRFWNDESSCLYDVIDAHDGQVRPNQTAQ